MTDKPTLRADLLARRLEMARADPAAGAKAAALCPPELFGRYPVVAGYRPFKGEIDPGPLMARFAAAGAALCLPVTAPRGSERALTFHLWREGDPLPRHAFGVEEPDPTLPIAEPDLIITPLVGFDARGHRMGYGQGHFDRTLADLRARRSVFVLGFAYAGQEVDRLPAEAHDERLDAILTETGYRRTGKDV